MILHDSCNQIAASWSAETTVYLFSPIVSVSVSSPVGIEQGLGYVWALWAVADSCSCWCEQSLLRAHLYCTEGHYSGPQVHGKSERNSEQRWNHEKRWKKLRRGNRVKEKMGRRKVVHENADGGGRDLSAQLTGGACSHHFLSGAGQQGCSFLACLHIKGLCGGVSSSGIWPAWLGRNSLVRRKGEGIAHNLAFSGWLKTKWFSSLWWKCFALRCCAHWRVLGASAAPAPCLCLCAMASYHPAHPRCLHHQWCVLSVYLWCLRYLILPCDLGAIWLLGNVTYLVLKYSSSTLSVNRSSHSLVGGGGVQFLGTLISVVSLCVISCLWMSHRWV